MCKEKKCTGVAKNNPSGYCLLREIVKAWNYGGFWHAELKQERSIRYINIYKIRIVTI